MNKYASIKKVPPSSCLMKVKNDYAMRVKSIKSYSFQSYQRINSA